MTNTTKLSLMMMPIAGCIGGVPADLTSKTSPNGSLTLIPSVNESKVDPTKYLCVKFTITGKDGLPVHSIQTGASDVHKWAIDWFDDATVVLYSSDIGTNAWKLNESGEIEAIPTPLANDLAAFGDSIKIAKYGE